MHVTQNVTSEKASDLALFAKRTGTKEDKGSTSNIAAVVDEKAHLRMKLHAKKSGTLPFSLLSYAWLKVSVSQIVS